MGQTNNSSSLPSLSHDKISSQFLKNSDVAKNLKLEPLSFLQSIDLQIVIVKVLTHC